MRDATRDATKAREPREPVTEGETPVKEQPGKGACPVPLGDILKILRGG